MSFISVSCLIALARAFSEMLERSDDSEHPYVSGGDFSPLKMMFAVGFL